MKGRLLFESLLALSRTKQLPTSMLWFQQESIITQTYLYSTWEATKTDTVDGGLCGKVKPCRALRQGLDVTGAGKSRALEPRPAPPLVCWCAVHNSPTHCWCAVRNCRLLFPLPALLLTATLSACCIFFADFKVPIHTKFDAFEARFLTVWISFYKMDCLSICHSDLM